MTACFVAYYTARRNTRRQFTLRGRENPVDELAQALTRPGPGRRGRRPRDAGLGVPAAAGPGALTAVHLGELLGDWHAVIDAAAAELERALGRVTGTWTG